MVSYDLRWRFRREWVREGVQWFILPATTERACINRYRQEKLEVVRAYLEGTRKAEYLAGVLNRILPGAKCEQLQIEAIVRFVQQATWHNPLECPFEADGRTIVSEAHELLELHDARCWHCAEIVRQLLQAGGWDARIRFLPNELSDSIQVVTEVLLSGAWRLLDANYFDKGTIPCTPTGALPTVAWLLEHPHALDSYPGGWIYPPEYLTNAAGKLVTGQFSLPFPEAPNTWGSDPFYCFYFGAEEAFPPTAVTGFEVEHVGSTTMKLSWAPSRSKSSHVIRYDVTVLREGDGLPIFHRRGMDEPSVLLNRLETRTVYSVAVAATDEHRSIEPRTWYPWSRTRLSLRDGLIGNSSVR